MLAGVSPLMLAEGVSAFVLTAVLIVPNLGLWRPRWLRTAYNALLWPIRPFLSIEDARRIVNGEGPLEVSATQSPIGRRGYCLSGLALGVCNVWLVTGGYQAHYAFPDNPFLLSYPFILAGCWLYSFVRPLVRTVVTVPYDLLAMNLLFSGFSVANAEVLVYDRVVLGVDPSWTPRCHGPAPSVTSLISGSCYRVLVSAGGTPPRC